MLFILLATLKAVAAAGTLLLAGDFTSTFVYHVPEHALGRLHCRVHHETKQTFQHYAVLSKNPWVMLDGLLGALPYILLAVALYPLSPVGTVIGLIFGEFHVVWRHTTKMGWQTPGWIQHICEMLRIVTPEEHWVHHENGAIAFGDIFTFFDQPAQQWLKTLLQLKKQFRHNAKQA
ncbi:MAG: fatty acid hydroxylase [Cyanobacteria bacterium J06632_3]